MAELKIGQVAARAGVRVDTVRYYEKLGLVPAAPRRASGYRAFAASTVERIRLIKQLQELGLSLQEIDAMLRATGEDATCARESAKIRAALARTEAQLAALAAAQAKLRRALDRCTRGACEIMAQVAAVARASAPGAAANRR